ncbi:STS14 protein [Abrus precatorius]|uniref:STS14 protein n=1 Tax=Abrus precatorius TaxID=3816 RepID=A0A8B8KPN7_ABRPR|nr:STS14 protein [Abrus precatorius]
MKMIHHALLLVAALATVHVSAEGVAVAPPPQPPLPAAAREFLDAHNQARAAVGVEPLKWSQQVANITSKLVRYQRNQMGCQFANLTAGKYGANQLLARGTAVTPRMAVEEWGKQRPFYNHTDNTCAPNHRCGVYTQVVWRKSLELGCAQATCVKEQSSLTICFYNPPGNYVGESPY